MTEPVITAIYDMPYAPDDYFYYEKSVRKLYRSGAQRAAEKFGQTEAALDVGHAYGQNIVTGFNETPTLDLAPVYIRLAGIEGAFLLDAASYAWGPEGMVVSSDLMLLGVTGYDGLVPPATSWLRLPAAPSAIAPAGATTIEASPVKANSISIPSGFDARNPAAVLASLPTNGVDVFREWRANTVVLPPALVLEQFIVAAGPYLAVREFEYGLILEPETAAIAAGPVAEFTWVTQVVPPAAALTLAGLAPAISTGVRVVVPSADAGLSALVPVVAGGASVAVPAANVAVVGVAPDLVGRQRTQVLVPVAGLSVAGLAPAVAGGASVAVPGAGVTVAEVTPAIRAGAFDEYFSSVSLLLHMDGSNGGTTFTDSSPNSLTSTANGNAQISTAQSRFGGTSASFDGDGDAIDIPGSSLLQFPGDFTIEAFVYATSDSSYRTILELGTYVNGVLIRSAVSGTNDFVYVNNVNLGSAQSFMQLNTWQHIALTRSGSTVRYFIDGIQRLTATISTTINSGSAAARIGRAIHTTGQGFSGYIDEFRITKGVARYTTNFTPPTAPFPDA